jgi:hypothetical protein
MVATVVARNEKGDTVAYMGVGGRGGGQKDFAFGGSLESGIRRSVVR